MSVYTLKTQQVDLNEEYDVIVAGGGPAGCAAATASAREGCKTLLIEAACALGGMGTLGLVPCFCGYHDRGKIIARGLAEKVLNACRERTPHLKKSMSETPVPSIIPEVLKRIYDDMVTGASANILFGSQVCGVEMAGPDRVDALLVANKAGVTAYRAAVYIDATGDGDVAAWAGAEFEKGDENGDLQPATHCFTITNIDEYALANGIGIHFYDQESPIHKAISSPDYPLIKELHSCLDQIGPKTFSFNTGHIPDVDNTDPDNLSKALIHGRRMVAQYHEAFAKFHPAFKNAFLSSTGDLLGIRETRRIVGDYVLTADDYLARRSFPDEICRNAYGIDVHRSTKISLANKTIDELKASNHEQIKPFSPGESFGVPYRCLTPKGLKNVLVSGRCISADRSANGSTRVMACCLNTGEAAGVAAGMAAKSDKDVHKMNTNILRQTLINHGAYLPVPTSTE